MGEGRGECITATWFECVGAPRPLVLCSDLFVNPKAIGTAVLFVPINPNSHSLKPQLSRMSSSSATGACSRSPSPSTPEASDNLESVVVQNDSDYPWSLATNPLPDGNMPWNPSVNGFMDARKPETSLNMFAFNDLIQEDACDEYVVYCPIVSTGETEALVLKVDGLWICLLCSTIRHLTTCGSPLSHGRNNTLYRPLPFPTGFPARTRPSFSPDIQGLPNSDTTQHRNPRSRNVSQVSLVLPLRPSPEPLT